MPLLLLVDGSSYLYRAFHALPDLRNKAGEPTGALYGVLNMLRRLESDYKADYKAVVFDAKGKTFRDDWYPEYKAHRPPMPDDLVRQIEPIHAAIRAAGWPLLMVDGVEADDVIGTLATAAAVDGLDTLISTGDKDLTQLVGPKVRWYNTMSNELLDEAGVVAKFGVPPGRIVDYLTLVGDPVDGVPGVQKCGPKTAVKWLEQYGSLDGIIAHAGEIGGVVGQNLRDHLGFLPLGRKLVTVACDLSNLPAPGALTATDRDTETLRDLYTRYEFRTWLRDLDAPASDPGTSEAAPIAATPPGAIPVSYETVLTWQQFDAWLDRIEAAELTALDTETTSLDSFAARIVGISLSVKVGEACYIPLAHTAPGAPDQLPRDEVLARLKPWLSAVDRKKVLQNAKYDQHVFANHGIALAGVAHDTMLQVLRDRVRQGPRPWPAVHPSPRAGHHRLRRPVRQGRQTDRLRPGRYRACRHLRRRRCRRHAARSSGTAPAIRRGKRSEPYLPRSRNAGPPGDLADGTHRHPDRRRDTDAPEPRNRPEDNGARSASLRTRRPALQPGLAEAAGRHSV